MNTLIIAGTLALVGILGTVIIKYLDKKEANSTQ